MLYFTLDGFHNRMTRDWARKWSNSHACVYTVSPAYAAKKHAREHGKAGMWRGDDSFVLFYMDNGTLKQKTWAKAAPNQFSK